MRENNCERHCATQEKKLIGCNLKSTYNLLKIIVMLNRNMKGKIVLAICKTINREFWVPDLCRNGTKR